LPLQDLYSDLGTEGIAAEKGFKALLVQFWEDYSDRDNVFTFTDASSIITKTALWEERDKAIKDGEETSNNAVVSYYAADKDAK